MANADFVPGLAGPRDFAGAVCEISCIPNSPDAVCRFCRAGKSPDGVWTIAVAGPGPSLPAPLASRALSLSRTRSLALYAESCWAGRGMKGFAKWLVNAIACALHPDLPSRHQGLPRTQLNGPNASLPLAALAFGFTVSFRYSIGLAGLVCVTRRWKLGTL